MDTATRIAFLAALVESSDDAIVSTGLDGTVTSWNRGASRLFGYSEAEMVGGDVGCLFPPERLHERDLIVETLRRGERLDGFETVRRRKDGTLVEIAVTNSPILDASGTMIGVSKVARDITERKRSEAMRSRLASIIECSDDAIVSKDLRGVIQSWNAGAERLFGYAAEEAVGRSMTMLLPPERAHEEAEILSLLRGGGRIDHRVTTRLAKDGRLVDVFVSVSPIRNAQGEIVGASNVARDITDLMAVRRERERWTAELEVRVEERTKALRAAVEEMESFAYSASHDLRAPLRTVELSRRMIEEDEGSSLSKAAREMLDRQSRATERMNRLIADLLNYSRLSRQEPSPRELDLSEIARRVWDEITRDGASPELQIEITLGLRAWGDATLVRFALQNLLQNAVKFSPSGGVVRVAGEGDGTFLVRDEGVGFDMAYAGKLFQPFHRLVRDAEFPGTGIGLANVRRIVERHGGRVWAESAPGEGATFRFTLPTPAEATTEIAA